jgi:hypothetical protein
MFSSRLLLLSLLAPVCAFAQTSADSKPSIILDPTTPPNTVLYFSAPTLLSQAEPPPLPPLPKGKSQAGVTVCYTMRTYHFKREDSNSKLKQDGYSTCQSSTELDLKKTLPTH